MAIRRATRRHTRNAGGLLVVLALVGALALHHSGAAAADTHNDGMAPSAIEMCIGVFTAIGAAGVAVALGVLLLRRWRVAPLRPHRNLSPARRLPLARARPGPSALAALCVLRR